MEQIKNEQTELNTHTATAEQVNGEEKSDVSLGKFKDVGALMEAYNSLQSEFTKRCQRLKELEAKIGSVDKGLPPSEDEKANVRQEDTTLIDKENVLKEYLLDIIGKKPKAIVMDGTGASAKTPTYKPKTIADAGKLAQEILNN